MANINFEHFKRAILYNLLLWGFVAGCFVYFILVSNGQLAKYWRMSFDFSLRVGYLLHLGLFISILCEYVDLSRFETGRINGKILAELLDAPFLVSSLIEFIIFILLLRNFRFILLSTAIICPIALVIHFLPRIFR